MSKQQVIFQDLGQMDYKTAWDYQEKLLQENVRKKSLVFSRSERTPPEESVVSDAELRTPDSELSTEHHLLFVEHPSVYTLGKSGNESNLLIDEHQREEKGVQYFKINRGGDITYHGPGQIVGYPILDLEKFYTDIGKYLRNIEETIILTLADYGIVAGRSPGETGVWIDADIKGRERKICAIGVRTSRWITMHGFALNVNTDLSFFGNIIPCGIQDKQVTSIEKELGHKIDYEEAKERVKKNFAKVFDVDIVYPH
jgi:lipoyl(octanoyl) transferase